MSSQSKKALRAWARSLPRSRMIYPDALRDRLKYFFWTAYTPLQHHLRDIALMLGILKQAPRQDFVLGYVAPHQSIQGVTEALIQLGFGNHFVATQEEGEIVSLRFLDGFTHQYHIRIFEDGEVRGHYELTPECSPVAHVRRQVFEDRRATFEEWLSPHLVSA